MSDLRSRYVQVRITARRIDQAPTRTIVEFSDGTTHPVPDDDVIQPGRLVDREAIDYEAAYDRLDAILARPEPVTADTIMGNLNSIVDAALGEET